jgi:hypothetical protein
MPGFFAPLLVIVVIWSLVWKGIALWRAAHNNHTAWFVVLLIVNTLGILEIIYLLTAGKKRMT